MAIYCMAIYTPYQYSAYYKPYLIGVHFSNYPSGTYTLLLHGLYVHVILLLLHLDDDCVGNDAYWRSAGVLTLPQTNVSCNKVMLLSL